QFLEDIIVQLLREGDFKGRRVAASMPAPLTHVLHLRLNRGDNAFLDAEMEEQLRGRVPVDPTQMVTRRVDVAEVMANGSAKQEVIAMAVRRSVVMHHVEILKRAGLGVVGIHCEPVAILEAFSHLFRRERDKEKTTLFIDLGLQTTKAIIAHGNQMVFAKMIQVAGEHFDRQFAEELGIDFAEARQRRRDQAGEPLGEGAPPELDRAQRNHAVTGAVIQNAAPEETESEATQAAVATEHALQPIGETIPSGGEMLDCLIDELQLCIGYHGSLFPQRRINSLVFIGGESRQIAMCQRIARALKLPAQLGDPLARAGRDAVDAPMVNVDLREPQPSFAVSLGLCRLPTNL
ncbi:MAG: pilus assembly protein PilM, partial [Desulfobacterales bacterium]|nr:pilus assembly protein PilM [Desulfobacterales bacterium]